MFASTSSERIHISIITRSLQSTRILVASRLSMVIASSGVFHKQASLLNLICKWRLFSTCKLCRVESFKRSQISSLSTQNVRFYLNQLHVQATEATNQTETAGLRPGPFCSITWWENSWEVKIVRSSFPDNAPLRGENIRNLKYLRKNNKRIIKT